MLLKEDLVPTLAPHPQKTSFQRSVKIVFPGRRNCSIIEFVLPANNFDDLSEKQADIEIILSKTDPDAYVIYGAIMVYDEQKKTFVPTSTGKEILKEIYAEFSPYLEPLRHGIRSLTSLSH